MIRNQNPGLDHDKSCLEIKTKGFSYKCKNSMSLITDIQKSQSKSIRIHVMAIYNGTAYVAQLWKHVQANIHEYVYIYIYMCV